MITIIGTSHIAKESVKKVKATIEDVKPDVVAVELDAKRLHAMFQKKQRFGVYNIGRIGIKGFLFAIVGAWVSKKLGRMVGVDPGEEMKTAIKLARKKKLKIALIDQDIEITLARFSKYLSWKERRQFVKDIFNGIFFRKREMKKYGMDKLDLSKVPSDVFITKAIGMIKLNYPNIYKVLIHERNKYMAKQLQHLDMKGLNVIAVVGAGHVEGITKILAKPEVSYTFSVDATQYQNI